ncbi:MAG: hypothetical protein K1X89_26825 [Myxococcaceae bacterium]|nr:hypothetical protein [Myxococcaceae bacterium]
MKTILGVAVLLGVASGLMGCGAKAAGCSTNTDCPSSQVCCARGGSIPLGEPTTHCLAPVFEADGGLGGYQGKDGAPSGCLPEI